MHGTKWFSFKHSAWAVVSDEPMNSNGYYLIEFPSVEGMYRRYSAERIEREVANQKNFSAQLDGQLSQVNGIASVASSVKHRSMHTESKAIDFNDDMGLVKHIDQGDFVLAMDTKKECKLIGLVFAHKGE